MPLYAKFSSANVCVSADYYMNLPQPDQDPLELAGLFEGDIAGSDGIGKNAIRDRKKLWPDATIPYEIEKSYGQEDRERIALAMQEIQKVSCVRFVPREDQNNYILIRQLKGCFGSPGMQGGKQDMSIGFGCEGVGTIIHEFMHTLGFYHEHSRTDRDKFIEIKWNNIRNDESIGRKYSISDHDVLCTDRKGQFSKYTDREIQHLNETYDYGSILHYNPTAFSKDYKSVTIVARKPGGEAMGQRKKLSETDIRKINKLYSCSQSSPVNKHKDEFDRYCDQGEWTDLICSMDKTPQLAGIVIKVHGPI
ncbi:MEP1B [Cordylochernes scorpioides]|uniref:Metalloendopeptidase n=1 Tax=Cordylochernes scorpioides TaxID=51811 RepID=A0ABY6K7X6_9ARAC|nr:MEP1B [Cordylochernes scorpioides]